MKKTLKIILLSVVALFAFIFIFGRNPEVKNQGGSSTQTPAVSRNELMEQNNPNIKRLNFGTADYIGKEFTFYVMAEVSDYYNYGFADENKYYSISIWDNSVSGSYEGTYAYVDKFNPELKARELFDLLLDEPKFIKVKVTIPAEKYNKGSNAFLEIESWEAI